MVSQIFHELHVQQFTVMLTLEWPIDINVPTLRAQSLETKYSFVLFVTHLNNKNLVCKQRVLL